MKRIAVAVALLGIVVSGCECATVEPGNRGVVVDWGKVKPNVLPEGWHTECFGCDIHQVSVRQQKQEFLAPCFSSDLQEVKILAAIFYRIPESSVVKSFKEYQGDPFTAVVLPLAQESLKEVTAKRTARKIVEERAAVKNEALASVKAKVNELVIIEDVVIVDVGLSKELSLAIEQSMIQQQQVVKAEFTKQLADKEAEITLAKANGEAQAIKSKAIAEAEAIKIRGEALRQNPNVIQLELINKWHGDVPQVVAGSNGTNILLPVGDLK